MKQVSGSIYTVYLSKFNGHHKLNEQGEKPRHKGAPRNKESDKQEKRS